MSNIAANSVIFTHPIAPIDKSSIAALRAHIEPHKGQLQGTVARVPFDGIMERVPPASDVVYEPGNVGGISGWWCQPPNLRTEEAILYLHGGWYNWGTAKAYRNFVGQVAKRAGAVAFIPEYRLAPENPFPAAVIDAESCYGGLLQHAARIAVVGDSAGGGLGLVLLSQVAQRGGIAPVAGVVLSPTTDLSLCSPSWETRSSADAYFTRSQASALVQSYLGTADPRDPRASALFGTLAGLPPIRVHVGEDEMLLDDAIRYVERAAAAGVDARVHVWEGMLHVFPSSIGVLRAADEALEQIGVFLADRLHRGA